jgi:hypothetical protein
MPGPYLTQDDVRLLKQMAAWWYSQPAVPRPQFRRLAPLPPHPLRLGKALERIYTTSSTQSGKIKPWVYVTEATSAGSTSEHTILKADTGSTGIDAYPWWQSGAASGEKVAYFREASAGRYVFFTLPTQRLTGQAKGAVSSSDGSFVVDNVTALWGASPTTAAGSTMTVQNVHNWDADDNARVDFQGNRSSSDDEAYQISCPST